jgi:hypothetical protein
MKNFIISYRQLGFELIQASREESHDIQNFVADFLEKLKNKYYEGEEND